MTLGIILSIGDSFQNLSRSGQDKRFIRYYLKPYSTNFRKIYIFSYENENPKRLPKNIIVVPNKYRLHRYIYAFAMPFFSFLSIDLSIKRKSLVRE